MYPDKGCLLTAVLLGIGREGLELLAALVIQQLDLLVASTSHKLHLTFELVNLARVNGHGVCIKIEV